MLFTPDQCTICAVCSVRVPVKATQTNRSIWCASLSQQIPLRCSLMLPGIRREFCSQLPCSQPIILEWFLPLGQPHASHWPGLPPTPPPAESSHGCGQTERERGREGEENDSGRIWCSIYSIGGTVVKTFPLGNFNVLIGKEKETCIMS